MQRQTHISIAGEAVRVIQHPLCIANRPASAEEFIYIGDQGPQTTQKNFVPLTVENFLALTNALFCHPARSDSNDIHYKAKW